MAGIDINYRIEPGDTETIYEKLRDLSEQDPGFDFDVHVDIDDNGMVMREFVAFSPHRGNLSSYSFEEGRNIKDLSYTHNGVQGTHIIGMGAGTARKVAAVSKDEAMLAKYRRLDHVVDLGPIIDKNVIQRQTDAERERLVKSVRGDLRATAIPEPNVDIWTQVAPGDICLVKGDTEYEYVNDYFRVSGFELNPSEQGDEEVSVIFEHGEI